MFIDNAKIYVKAGDGGNGVVSFHREKYVVNGGPDGGDGGRGGNVIFAVDQGIRTLADFRYKRKYKADNGKDGGSRNCSGKGADDLIIKVPEGTIIKDETTGRIIADLKVVGDFAVIAKGGKGGAGNQHFATSTRQIPNFAKAGESGQELWILLEIKLLADVGLLGYPNVGKSTILSMVSAAKPKIDNYPFTTIQPNLGVVNIDSANGFVLADIPGLIEGAHEGVGLGHQFLKHVERTKLLIHVVDIAAIEGRDPIKDFDVINEELKEYNPLLAQRPQIVAANKIDIPESDENLALFTKEIEARGFKVFPISAATNKGIRELIYYVSEKLKEIPETILKNEAEDYTVYKVEDKSPFEIRIENNVFVVEGEWVKRLVNSTNFTDYESLQYFQRAIKAKGIIDQLEKMGINEGDSVRVHDFEFDYLK